MNEDWSGAGIADHWQAAFDPAVFAPSLSSTVFREGNASQKLSFQKTGGPTSSISLTTGLTMGAGPLQPGTTIQISFSYFASATTANTKWKVWGNWTDASGVGADVDLSQLAWLNPSPGWQTWTGSFFVPGNATSVVIGIYLAAQPGAAQGHFYIDDAHAYDGNYLPEFRTRALPTFSIYDPYPNWVDTGTYYDGAAFHAWHDRDAIEATYPNFLTMQWIRVAYVSNDYSETPENPFTYQYILENHPEWFLRDSNGEIISGKGQSSLDVGNVSYQQALIAKLLDYADRQNWRCLFLEYFDIHADHNTLDGRRPVNYPTDAQWQTACTSMFQALQPLRQRGIKLVANIAHVPSYMPPASTWMGLLDGMEIEWGYVTQDRTSIAILYSPYSSWLWKFRTQSENWGKIIIIGHRLPEEYLAARRYAMASFLLGMTTNTYFGFCESELLNGYSTDFEAPLGAPVGNYVVEMGSLLFGGLFSREFENGIVYVNPTDWQTYTIFKTGWHKDLEGNYVGPKYMVFPPKTAVILIKAIQPNIDPAQAPGDWTHD